MFVCVSELVNVQVESCTGRAEQGDGSVEGETRQAGHHRGQGEYTHTVSDTSAHRPMLSPHTRAYIMVNIILSYRTLCKIAQQISFM